MAEFRTLHFCELCPSSTKEEVSQGDKTFLAGFLGKLLDHIIDSTETSVLDLDFDGILKNLRTVEETSFNLSQTVPSLRSFGVSLDPQSCCRLPSCLKIWRQGIIIAPAEGCMSSLQLC